MSSKRQKRFSASAEEYADHISRMSVDRSFRAKPDEDLFTLDRSGSQTSRKRIAREISIKAADKSGVANIVSIVERKLVKRAVGRGPVAEQEEKALSDIWGIDAPVVVVDHNIISRSRKSRTENLLKAKCSVAIKGQSYNPSHTDHQDALAEALAVEIRKKEHDLRTKGWLTTSIHLTTIR